MWKVHQTMMESFELIYVEFFVAKGKRLIFWKGLKGTISLEMIRVTYFPLKIKWCVFLGRICVCDQNC
jgi:hypothetical protein